MHENKIGLVDADIIAYRVSAAMEKEPPESVEAELTSFCANLMLRVGCSKYIFFLTGEGNFREEIAKTKKYKGNRKAPKPKYLQEVRQLLLDNFNALLVEGYEADDALVSASERYFPHAVIISIDKDLLQQRGWHYNFMYESFTFITEEEANKRLWTQVITGDPTDNIPGLPKVGKVKAEKYMNEHTIPALACVQAYKDKLGEDYYGYMTEQLDLIRMRRDLMLPYEEYIIDFKMEEQEEEENIDDLF